MVFLIQMFWLLLLPGACLLTGSLLVSLMETINGNSL